MEIKFPYGISPSISSLTAEQFTSALDADLDQNLMGDESQVETLHVKIRAYVSSEFGQTTIAAVLQRTQGESDQQDITSTNRLCVLHGPADVLYDLQDFLVHRYGDGGIMFPRDDLIISAIMDALDIGDLDLPNLQQKMNAGPGPVKEIVAPVIEINYTLDATKLQVSVARGFEYTINDAEVRRREAELLGLKVEIPDAIRHQVYFGSELTYETLPVFN